MKKINIIPAIDIQNGQCVRLVQGDYSDCTIYHSKPVEVARAFEEAGLERLHLVDLDGAKSGSIQNLAVLKDICQNTSLKVDFSGGVKSEKDLVNALEGGASYVGIGSLAIQQPALVKEWLHKYGGDKMIVSADVWGDKIAIMGWTEQTNETIYQFIDYYIDDLQYVISTDISKDGMLNGPSLNLYRNLKEKYKQLHLIASGGVSRLEDLDELEKIGVSEVIVGKAIYEKRITLNQLKSWINR